MCIFSKFKENKTERYGVYEWNYDRKYEGELKDNKMDNAVLVDN